MLSIFVSGYEQYGTPPTATWIGEQLGVGGALVSRALRALCTEGAIAQPYGEHGPYAPLRRPDGTPVRVLLVDTEGPTLPPPNPRPHAPPEGLTVREAAEQLQITERTVHRWIRSGRLKAEKHGMEWRIDRESAGVQVNEPGDPDTLHAMIDELPEAKREAAEVYLRFLLEQG